MSETLEEAQPPAWQSLQLYLAMSVGSKTAFSILDIARRVAMEEREACAALAASHASRNDVARIDYMARAEEATAIAAAIRARSKS